jgi:16S rRNA (cytosine967-C5)-methyltransferase
MSGVSKPRRDRGRRRTARGAAYDLLHAVHVDDAYANLALPEILDRAGLSTRDAALTTELAYGTLRWQGLYDAVLGTCVDRPLSELDGRLLDVLRLGCHQVLAMRIPAHAAVSETVALARDVVGEGPARLANAVLRKVVDGGDRDAWIERVAPGDGAVALATATSHPAWIVHAFHQALMAHRGSSDPQELRALLDADNEPARPVLVARDITGAELCALPGVEPGRWSPRAGVLVEGRPDDLYQVRNGAVGVQDEGSQLVALALAAAPVEGRDEVWADLAAGPGGKAALLARIVAERGGHLVAVEMHPHRADLVRRSLPDGPHEVLVGDGRTVLEPSSADRVLVDAPCTGLGALRRRPEARWRRSSADLATLGPLQRELLDAALDVVRPGGVVMYATCSPHVAETDLVVQDVLKRRSDVEQEDVRPLLPGLSDLGPGPSTRLWPHVHGTDGMYLALLRRV